MPNIPLSPGETFVLSKKNGTAYIKSSTDSVEQSLFIRNDIYVTGSAAGEGTTIFNTGYIELTNTNTDPYIVFKPSTVTLQNFVLGYDDSQNQFALGTGIALSPGATRTVFHVPSGSRTLHVDEGLTVTGSAYISNDLQVTGSAYISNDLQVTGSAYISSSITASSITATRITATSITASGIISASGTFFGSQIKVSDYLTIGLSPISTADLYVNGTSAYTPSLTYGAAAAVIFRNSGGEFAFGKATASPYRLYIQGRTSTNTAEAITINPLGGNVGIGYLNPYYKLDVNGQVAGTGAFYAGSDKRLKRDILPIENALDKILMLNGVTYNWNKEFAPDKNLDDRNHIGLLAQDVEKIIPQAVLTDNSKHQLKSMAYTELIPVLIEAIKEQQTQINELKNKLKDTPYG